MISYKTFRFCRNPIISIILAFVGVNCLFNHWFTLPWWASSIIAFITTVILSLNLPLLGTINTFAFIAGLVASIIIAISNGYGVLYVIILFVALGLYLYRFIITTSFYANHIKVANLYDQWIAENYKEMPPEVDAEILKAVEDEEID